MAKLFFDRDGCVGATSGYSGRSYDAKDGFITVNDSKDVEFLKKNGYSEAGGMPHFKRYWVCDDCGWEAALNHCRYCDSTDLRKVEPS